MVTPNSGALITTLFGFQTTKASSNTFLKSAFSSNSDTLLKFDTSYTSNSEISYPIYSRYRARNSESSRQYSPTRNQFELTY